MLTETVAPPRLKQGDERWFFGQLAIIRATAADTAGAYSLVEIQAPPGLSAPLHVHHGEDEGFLVLEGSLRVQVGDDTIELGPGQFALGPRGVPHRFDVGPEGAHMLWVLTPAGFEDLIAAVSVPAAASAPPPPEVVPPADAAEIVARFGNELLG